MASNNEKNAKLTAEVIAYLVRLGNGVDYTHGFTSAQWAALRYFSMANRFSRTLSAFADYHVTTRGTASQTVNNLVKKGFLKRMPSPINGRSRQIDLTTKAHAMNKVDPFEELVQVLAELPETQLGEMTSTLERVMRRIAGDLRRPFIGTCLICRHLEESAGEQDSEKTYTCSLVGKALGPSEIGELCINYKPYST